MAGSKSAYLENKALDIILGGTSWTAPATVYIALSTAAFSTASTGSSMTEVSGGSYARVSVTNNSTNWPNASSGSKANGAVFTFPAATANWGTVLSFYIVDASSAGNVLYGADLTTSRTINNGDTASFAVSAITLTET
jgi:hypothetical protein